jgi:hypothetical protein
MEPDTALSIFQEGFTGSTASLVVVGGLGVTLGAIQWGVPYLKKFFRKTAS